MTTLIEVRNSSGVVGRCDARCYNAKNPDCDCICGGKNHGAGIEKAVDNTREMVETWFEAYKDRKNLGDDAIMEVAPNVYQMSLF